MVDTMPLVIVIAVTTTAALMVMALRKWARDREIVIPAGRRVTGPESA